MINPRSIATLGFSCGTALAVATIGLICIDATQDLSNDYALNANTYTTPYTVTSDAPAYRAAMALPFDFNLTVEPIQAATVDRTESVVTTAREQFTVQTEKPSYNIRVDKAIMNITVI